MQWHWFNLKKPLAFFHCALAPAQYTSICWCDCGRRLIHSTVKPLIAATFTQGRVLRSVALARTCHAPFGLFDIHAQRTDTPEAHNQVREQCTFLDSNFKSNSYNYRFAWGSRKSGIWGIINRFKLKIRWFFIFLMPKNPPVAGPVCTS